MATCHPDRRNHALGFCKSCWGKREDVKARRQEQRKRSLLVNPHRERAARARYMATHRDDILRHDELRRRLNRAIVIDWYSNGGRRCACCSESRSEFLTIDHLNNDGNKHRRQISRENIYGWLIRNDFPSGFRVLCLNCNWSLGVRGYCPHQMQNSFGLAQQETTDVDSFVP